MCARVLRVEAWLSLFTKNRRTAILRFEPHPRSLSKALTSNPAASTISRAISFATAIS